MSGGRRKSRKPQKWEDYVADEEQLATIEKELEKEEKARMKNAENDGDLTEKSPDDAAQNEEDEEMTDYDDDAAQLEIILGEDEEEEKLHDFKTELDKEGTQEEEEEGEEKYKEEKPQLINIPGTGQVIGDCTTCSIQLRDWNSVHSHLRFHRLSHVPECSYKLVSALSKRINCQVCHRCCQNREVLAYHAYTEHYISCKDSKICPFCSTNFKDMDEFQEHLDIDVISFKCQVCGVSMNQEHKFYQHIVYCTKKHQLGITTLPCCICGITISINNLYNHLMQHSTLLSLPRHLANNNRRCCELCGRSGFLNDELLIRHCILRCSQRNNLQVSFAVIVSSLAKNQNLGFSETVRSSALQTYLKLGIEAWGSPLCVKQFLEELQSNQPPTPSSGHRWDSAECTDVQLLAYLDQFDEKNREQDRELEFLLDMKSKDVSGSQMEGLSMMENLSSLNPVDRKSEFSDKITLGPVDMVTSSPCTNGDPETPSKNTAGWTNSQVDLSSLMQHLRRGTDKRRADEEGGGGGPIDICLVTSTTNTQVTITPAGCQPHGIRPPKVARSVSHRPSVSQIRSIYPGVTLLRDVDFSRVPSVILQMQEMMSYSVQKEMEEADISPSDLQRLEVEAQFLREAEPFYLRDDPQWQLPKCSSRIMNRSSNKKCNTIPDPATLTRIIAEAGVVYDAGRNIVLDDPNAMKCPGKAHIARLLQETQKFFFV